MTTNDISITTLATLDEVKRELLERGVEVTEDAEREIDIMDVARSATAEFETRTDKYFQPRPEARYFDARPIASGGDVNGLDLILDQELYELTSIVNGQGDSVSAYTLIPKTGAPYSRIRMTPGTTVWTPDIYGDPRDAICVNGVWVGGRAHSGQWFTGVDKLDAGVDADDATFEMTLATNVDPLGRTPKFSPGMLLRATVGGATEYFGIIARSADGGTLTVRRGERGTTPIPLPDDTPVDVWWVDQQVAYAVAVEAAYRFARRGNFQLSETDAATGNTRRFSTGNTQRFEDAIESFQTSATTPRVRAI